MNFKIKAKGHKNILSKHKSTFEITKDSELSLSGDCIIGVAIDKSMIDFPKEFKENIAKDNKKIIIKLCTENGKDEITGFGHKDLTLSHPTDIVCRKSDYICSKTLMIKANKAAVDLNPLLIEDLKKGTTLNLEIIVKN